MMHRLLIGFFLGYPLLGFSQNDIWFETKINPQASSAVWSLIQNIYKNIKNEGLLEGISEPLDVLEFELPEAYARGVQRIRPSGETIRLRIQLGRIQYKIKDLNLSLHSPIGKSPTLLQIQYQAAMTGLNLQFLDNISLELVQGTQSLAQIKAISPGLEVGESLPLQFGGRGNLEVEPDKGLCIYLERAKYGDLSNDIKKNASMIRITTHPKNTPSRRLDAQAFVIPQVTIRLSSLVRNLDPKIFEQLLSERLPEILDLIIGKIADALPTDIAPNLFANIFSDPIPTGFELSTDVLDLRVKTHQVSTPSGHLKAHFKADLCEKTTGPDGTCESDMRPPTLTEKALETIEAQNISQRLNETDADFVLSFSQDFLQRLTQTLTSDPQLTDRLAENDLSFGPKRAVIVLNEPKTGPEVVIDLLYSTRGIGRIIASENRPIRVPLRYGIKFQMVGDPETPKLKINLDHLESDVNEILHGVPELNIESDLRIPIFRRKLARKIIRLAEEFENLELAEIKLDTLKNVPLNQAWFESSTHQAQTAQGKMLKQGRLNLFLKSPPQKSSNIF